MTAREKADKYLIERIPVGGTFTNIGVFEVPIREAFEAGYRAALGWVLEYATEIAEKYKSENFGMPLIPANTLKSKIQKELGDDRKREG